jgi:hypothetical protein
MPKREREGEERERERDVCVQLSTRPTFVTQVREVCKFLHSTVKCVFCHEHSHQILMLHHWLDSSISIPALVW